MNTGTSDSPARCAARHRRSPATMRKPSPSSVTTSGCTIPCARIDSASSSNAVSSKWDLGCNRFGRNLEVGMDRPGAAALASGDCVSGESVFPGSRAGALAACAASGLSSASRPRPSRRLAVTPRPPRWHSISPSRRALEQVSDTPELRDSRGRTGGSACHDSALPPSGRFSE